MKIRTLAVAAALGLFNINACVAETKSTVLETPDPVFVFNKICYTQVHNVSSIKDMATQLAWRTMDKDEVEGFRSYENVSELLGWNVQVGKRLFKVGVVKGDLTDKMKSLFPEFNNGVATSCSMVLDEKHDAAEFLPNMQILAGKEPVSRDVPEGKLLTTTWAGGNDDLKVFLFAKAPPTNAGGLLNVTIISKK